MKFEELRRANVERCESAFHAVEDWSLTDWGCAAAGEMGEACNVIKKLRRLEVEFVADHGDPALRLIERHQDQLHRDLADEIADTVIYLDLLAARAGFDLESAIRSKFNSVSHRVGSSVRL